MNKEIRLRRRWISTGILLCLATPPAEAQLRLYDAKRNAAAQEAKKTVDKIQSHDLFKKQEDNLRRLTERDITTNVEDARLEMTTAINAFTSWSDVKALKDQIKPACMANPGPNATEAQGKLKAQEAVLNSEIKAIQASATSASDPSLDRLANDLGQFDSALKFANDQLSLDKTAVTATIGVLDQLDSLYKGYQEQMKAIDAAKSHFRDLKIELKKALLSRLKVDEVYLLTKVALYKRCLAEFEPIQQLIERYDKHSLPQGITIDQNIDVTLKLLSGKPEDLQQVADLLFVGAALASRGQLPGRLYRLRAAELEHLHSIQSSAANARVYETILGGGVERLALFYQGGIKPETLGQIIQSLSTAGIFGKIVSQ